MWHRVDQTDPPTGEFVITMDKNGIEDELVYYGFIWYDFDGMMSKTTPLFWKRMGT